MAPSPVNIADFCATQLALLEQESAFEIAENSLQINQSSPAALQRAGLALLNLTVSSQRTGLGGKLVIELSLDSAVGGGDRDLPEHGIRPGDIVSVREQAAGSAKKKELADLEKSGADGVVTRVRAGEVTVALTHEDDEPPGEGRRLWLVKLADDVTYKRMNQTMKRMQSLTESEITPLMRVLFGHSSPTPITGDPDELAAGFGELQFIDTSLNASQRDAVRFAMAAQEVALIHGPPGTGKTHTLIELILQLTKQNLRILVCGPSNISVDNIVERLASHKVPIVRLGHPARLLPSVLAHSLDILTQTSEAAIIVRDVRTEIDMKLAGIKKTRNGRERRVIYGDIKDLRKEYRERERKCTDNIIGGSKITLSTLHGAGGQQLRNQRFDVVVIDECSQALEAQCWVALSSAKKVVLAGDHHQLPPTIKSLNSKSKSKSKPSLAKNESVRLGNVIKGMTLSTTLFERLLAMHGSSIKRLLNTQYRMHEKIMEFASKTLYDGKLVAAQEVKSWLLTGLPYAVKETDETRSPLVFWDTQGGDFPERAEEEAEDKSGNKRISSNESKSNHMEASLVKLHVSRLVEAGVLPTDIAVITPYNAQLAVLSQELKPSFPGIELGSVDGFQGREKEAVIVSLVRSNSEKEVGFLGEKRRLNVAMTRPKRHLCVIGDSETVSSGSGYLKQWMSFLEDEADLRYPDVADLGT